MLTEILVWLLVATVPILILLKNDQQMVVLLEGKLFKRGADISAATKAFGRHKKIASAAMFVVGFWIAAIGILVDAAEVKVVLIALGSICAIMGMLGRARSFLAADKDLG